EWCDDGLGHPHYSGHQFRRRSLSVGGRGGVFSDLKFRRHLPWLLTFVDVVRTTTFMPLRRMCCWLCVGFMGSDSCLSQLAAYLAVCWCLDPALCFCGGGLLLRRRFWCCSWSVAVGVVVLAVFVAHCVLLGGG
ncbi:hypothetical protein A2U01_0045855, partial [Trifolium medium]|nr:hypothetical protein [Trifolium medium]